MDKTDKPKKKAVSKTPTVTVAVPVSPTKKYTFEQWAARRKILTHHQGGLRAFVQNPKKSRTLADWDAIFAAY